MAFQSSILKNDTLRIPSFAVDSTVDIFSECAKTTSEQNFKSWWVVDLENVYLIEKVCLLNSVFGEFFIFLMKYFCPLYLFVN